MTVRTEETLYHKIPHLSRLFYKITCAHLIKNILHFVGKYDTIYKKTNPVTACPPGAVGKDTPCSET